VLLLALRLGGGRPGRWLVAAWVSLFRNTPLLVQLLFWYFAAWNLLPLAARGFALAVADGAQSGGNLFHQKCRGKYAEPPH
jgi:ABC-type amino acid transport system permease subunit